MIGFSIEFRRWYFVLRGPRGRVYLATGFSKRFPMFTSCPNRYDFNQDIDDTYSAILADEWREDETDQELLNALKRIR